MARCPECGDVVATGSQCLVEDSDTFSWSGDGAEDSEYGLEPNLDADLDNLLACTADGIKVILPTAITNPPACYAYRTTGLSVANNTLTAVNFDSEKYDTDTMHDLAANTNRITIFTSGTYIVTFNGTWNKNTTGTRMAILRKNGTTILDRDTRLTGGADLLVGHSLSWQGALVATDYVEILVHHTAGAALILLASPFLTAAKL